MFLIGTQLVDYVQKTHCLYPENSAKKFHDFFEVAIIKGEVLGKVDQFFWKKEYQMQGAMQCVSVDQQSTCYWCRF